MPPSDNLERSTSADPFQYTFAPDFKLTYTNFVQGLFSPLDLGLMCGEVVGAEGKNAVQWKIKLTMSPAEAKIVHRILSNLLRNYEKAFGDISVPAGLMPDEQ